MPWDFSPSTKSVALTGIPVLIFGLEADLFLLRQEQKIGAKINTPDLKNLKVS